MEAEGFDSNTPATFQGTTHAWQPIDEFAGAQAMQSLPDDSNVSIQRENLDSSPRLDYNLLLEEAGTYRIWLRVSPIASGNTVYAGLNGTLSEVGASGHLQGNNIGSLQWEWISASETIFIEAGMQTFNLWMRENGFYIDRIILANNDTFEAPSDAGPPTSRRNRPPETVTYVQVMDQVATDVLSIPIGSLFSDPEGDPLSFSSISSSNTEVATVTTNDEDEPTLIIMALRKGQSTITVEASDSNSPRTTNVFTYTVSNSPPLATGSLNLEPTAADGPPFMFDPATIFSDADNDPLTFEYASSNPEVASIAETEEGLLAITPASKGTTTLSIIATDNDEAQSAVVALEYIVNNTPPAATGTLSPEPTTAENPPFTFDPSTLFADTDNDPLTFEFSSSLPEVASIAETENGILTITPQRKGSTTISIIAIDNDGARSAPLMFDFSVNNTPPARTNTTVQTGDQFIGSVFVLNLNDYFTDRDGDVLVFAPISSDASIASVNVQERTMVVTAIERGTAVISVTANDGESTSETLTFIYVVNNRSPVAGEITIPIQIVGDVYSVDPSLLFDDEDMDPLLFAATSSNTAVASAAIEQDSLRVMALSQGTAVISIAANDNNGGTASLDVDITVVDCTPPVQNTSFVTPSDQVVGDIFSFTVSDVFTDPGLLAFESLATSDSSVVSLRLLDEQNAEITALNKGTASISVRATNGQGCPSTRDIAYTVNNSLPVCSSLQLPSTLLIDEPAFSRSLSGSCFDADDDALAFSATSDNLEVLSAEVVEQDTLIITPLGPGTATVEIRASDEAGSFVTFVLAAIRVEESAPVFFYPATLNYSISRSFGDATVQTNYRLLGLPGNTNMPLSSMLSGVPGEQGDWRAFWDDGSPLNGLVEYTANDPRFVFQPGGGFWLLSKNPVVVPQTETSTVSLDDDRSYSIDVHPGWNIISNPFDMDIAWTHIQTFNCGVLNETLMRYEGNFRETETFQSAATNGEAFYFHNTSGVLDSLKIPYGEVQPSHCVTPIPIVEPPTAWTLFAYTKDPSGTTDMPASLVRFGLAAEAHKAEDKYDQWAPPAFFETASVRLHAASSEPSHTRILREEYRPEGAHGEVFELSLTAPDQSEVTLILEGPEAHTTAEVYLIEPMLSTVYPLRNNEPLTLPAGPNGTRYRLVIGSPEFVEGVKTELIPKVMALLPNFPNPFSTTTTIEYTVPEEAEESLLRIEVYNVLGQHVRTLLDGLKAPGRHRITWNGTDYAGRPLGDGLYFYRLQSSGHTTTRSMVLRR